LAKIIYKRFWRPNFVRDKPIIQSLTSIYKHILIPDIFHTLYKKKFEQTNMEYIRNTRDFL